MHYLCIISLNKTYLYSFQLIITTTEWVCSHYLTGTAHTLITHSKSSVTSMRSRQNEFIGVGGLFWLYILRRGGLHHTVGWRRCLCCAMRTTFLNDQDVWMYAIQWHYISCKEDRRELIYKIINAWENIDNNDLWFGRGSQGRFHCWESWGSCVQWGTGLKSWKEMKKTSCRVTQGRSLGKWHFEALEARCVGKHSGTLLTSCAGGWTHCGVAQGLGGELLGKKRKICY